MMNEKRLSVALTDALELAEDIAEMLVLACREFERDATDTDSWTARADTIKAKLTLLRRDSSQLHGEIM